MYRTKHTGSSSIGQEFMTFGHEALAVHRAEERRVAERERDQITNALRATHPTPFVRRWLGTMMIALGTGIAGKASRLEERQPISPMPGTRSRLAPTR